MINLKNLFARVLLVSALTLPSLESLAEQKEATTSRSKRSSELTQLINDPNLLKLLGLTNNLTFSRKFDYSVYHSKNNDWIQTQYSDNGEVSITKGLRARFSVPGENSSTNSQDYAAYTLWLKPVQTNNILAIQMGDCTLKKVIEQGKSYIFGGKIRSIEVEIQKLDSEGIKFKVKSPTKKSPDYSLTSI